ncbi:MAG: hypothetical protein ACYC3A_02570 [Halothiobacillus sp.]
MLMSRFFPSVLFIFVLGMGGLLFTAQTADDVAQFIQDRRGGSTPKAVLVQKLNKFGSPSLAVSTFEHEALLTIAGLLNVAPDDQVIVYDDRAPTDAQCFMAPTSKKYVKHTVQPMPSAV